MPITSTCVLTVTSQFFCNMIIAGTIIFGGGPVVIPLLRDYVVVEGESDRRPRTSPTASSMTRRASGATAS